MLNPRIALLVAGVVLMAGSSTVLQRHYLVAALAPAELEKQLEIHGGQMSAVKAASLGSIREDQVRGRICMLSGLAGAAISIIGLRSCFRAMDSAAENDNISSQQSGPAYPPQGVGSADP